MPEAVGEVGFGLPRAQPRGKSAKNCAPPRLDDDDLRRAAAHRRPEEDDVRPPSERRIGADDSRLLFHRERLTVMLASLTRKSLASRIRPSAGTRLPAESTR